VVVMMMGVRGTRSEQKRREVSRNVVKGLKSSKSGPPLQLYLIAGSAHIDRVLARVFDQTRRKVFVLSEKCLLLCGIDNSLGWAISGRPNEAINLLTQASKQMKSTRAKRFGRGLGF